MPHQWYICMYVGACSSAATLQYYDWQREALCRPCGPYRDKLGRSVDLELACMRRYFITAVISNRPSPLLQDAYYIIGIDARASLLLPRSFHRIPIRCLNMEVALTRVPYSDTVCARLIVKISKRSRGNVIPPPAMSFWYRRYRILTETGGIDRAPTPTAIAINDHCRHHALTQKQWMPRKAGRPGAFTTAKSTSPRLTLTLDLMRMYSTRACIT